MTTGAARIADQRAPAPGETATRKPRAQIVEDLIPGLVDNLSAVARLTGDHRFTRAAAQLSGKGWPGRRKILDSEALTEMHWLIQEGRAATAEQAARLIAHRYPGNSSQATARRLGRKFRAAACTKY